jgi:hypothetical protein
LISAQKKESDSLKPPKKQSMKTSLIGGWGSHPPPNETNVHHYLEAAIYFLIAVGYAGEWMHFTAYLSLALVKVFHSQ